MKTYKDAELNELINHLNVFFPQNTSQFILYGSYARGDNNEFSDIDLMILTDLSEAEIVSIEDSISDAAYEFELEKGVPVSVNIKNKEHFSYWAETLPYYKNIAKEGIVLVG